MIARIPSTDVNQAMDFNKKKKRMKWTDEADAYLRKKYQRNSNELVLRGLKKKGYECTLYALYAHVKKLGLRKDEDWLKKDMQRRALMCIEKRGEDFSERQRQRALHPGESGWWGGKHHNGSKMSRERRAEMARRVLHKPEVQQRSHETRRKTVRRDMRRVDLGLEPLTSILNIGEPMTREQMNQRYQMCYECRYIKYKGDKNLYYDEDTKRSEQRERRAESLGITVMPLRLRGKAGVTAPHYGNDNN